MKLKKFLASFLSVLALMVAVALPASADTRTEVMVARINGGATVSSGSVKKTAAGNFKFNAQANTNDGWSMRGDEYVYFRGRSQGNYQATGVTRECYYGSQVSRSLPYLSGYGSQNLYYKIAIEYDNNNPYEYVNLRVNWTP